MFCTNIFDEFACIGGECINNCCRRWKIGVDEETARFYLSLDDDYGKMIQEFMKKKEDGSYYLPNDEVPFCPMMTEDKLCGVYQRYGENRMSKTCRTFPRMNITSPDPKFSIATVVNDCEEVLRMFMDDPDHLVIEATSDDDRVIEESENLNRYVLGFARKGLELLQDEEVPFGIAIGSLVAMMVDMVSSAAANDITGISSKLENSSLWKSSIGQVISEFSSDELEEFSWGIALRIVVGFLDILYVSNFAPYTDVLPSPEKYTNQGINRGEQIRNAFQSFFGGAFQKNERLFRKIVGNIFIQYAMCSYRSTAVGELLYEMAPRILISLIVPALWPDSVWDDRCEFLPRISMLQRIAKGDYMTNHLSPAIRDQMGVDEGTYAVMFAGVLQSDKNDQE